MSKSVSIHTSGKRKSAIARATIKPGTGKVKINKVMLEQLQPALSKAKMQEPLILADSYVKDVDISVTITGGGVTSQADAGRLAITRALVEFYAKDKKLEKIFLEYDRQLLVADVRRKESTKPGTHGKARSKIQKSYR